MGDLASIDCKKGMTMTTMMKLALAAALAGIRTDSQRESETYLRDTVVPHGGE